MANFEDLGEISEENTQENKNMTKNIQPKPQYNDIGCLGSLCLIAFFIFLFYWAIKLLVWCWFVHPLLAIFVFLIFFAR